jgi:hypothetical protein
MQLPVKGIMSTSQCFHGRGTLQYSIKSLPENGRSSVALVRQPLIIQAREYSTLLIMEN